jgi:hypothetical protein
MKIQAIPHTGSRLSIYIGCPRKPLAQPCFTPETTEGSDVPAASMTVREVEIIHTYDHISLSTG